jgi:hypothetical protein
MAPLYIRKSGAWVAAAGSTTVVTPPPVNPPPVTTTRDSLVPGTYKPNTSSTVGVLPGVARTPVYAASGATSITLAGGVYSNKTYWTQVKISGDATFNNCWFAGRDPNLITTLTGNLSNLGPSGGAPPVATLIDCTVSQKPWTVGTTERPLATTDVRTINPDSAGIHGGNIELYRTEITDVQDGINYTTGTGSHCLIEACWIHRMYYQNAPWPNAPASGDTHSDGFQFNRGKDVEIRYSVIGGNRDLTGYNIPAPNAYNSGDDIDNAGFMVKQEVGSSSFDLVENVNIHHNWIYGCTSGLNHVYVAAKVNNFSTMQVVDNKFGQRPSAWGGYYVLKSPSIAAVYARNTIEETGAPIPYSVGQDF